VYQFLQALTIWQGQLPSEPFDFASPVALMESIGDTLRGANYTRYYYETSPSAMAAGNGYGTVYLDSLTPKSVLLTITGFEGQTWEDFKKACLDTTAQYRIAQFQNIVIDVRQNRGGYLDILDSILTAMLPEGTPVVQARYRDYDDMSKSYVTRPWERWVTAAGPDAVFADKKFAVLMDGFSASASEILISAVYEGTHAPLYGERTYGKGIGQIHIPRRTRPTVQVTFLQLQGVSERIGEYHRKGIEPDSLSAGMRQEGAALVTDQRPVFYAVKTLEPSVRVSDINYPAKKLYKTAGLSASPACVKVIPEQEILSRLNP
jgi:hypothetical protein